MSASLILSASGNNGRQIGSLLAYRESLTGNGVIGIEFPFTRTTTGMERLSDGIWRDAAINLPRRYWDGTKYSYLFEPARTNVILHSNDFSQSVWAPSNSLNIVRGTNSIIADATNGNHRLGQNSVSITTNGTISFFVKPNGYSKIGVRDGNTGNYCSFHLSGAGSILQNSGFTTPAITYDSVSDLYYITVSLTASSINPQLYILEPSYTTGSITGSWIGDNVSGILLYYFQIESGLFATSPIITTGSAVLRAADVPQLTGASALIGQTEGTLFSHFELTNLSGDRTILEIGADNNNRIRLRINGNTLSGNVVVGGVSVGVVQFNGITLGIYKLAYTYKNNEFKAYLNGVAGTPSLSGSIPSNMSIIAVGTRLLAGGADYFNDRVIESKVYPTSLSNAELAALTTL
jgi:hypothetical protein